MFEDVENEVQVINSIYGHGTLRPSPDSVQNTEWILVIPYRNAELRLMLPDDYPENRPFEITAVETTGANTRKGYGNQLLVSARHALQKVFTRGQVCVFDLLQELEQTTDSTSSIKDDDASDGPEYPLDSDCCASIDGQGSEAPAAPDRMLDLSHWTLSNPVTEKKSIFLARACAVQTTIEGRNAVSHLLFSDRRTSKATHNISAYRIRAHTKGADIVYQDCDDDGEDAAGGRLLKLLQMMDVWNVVVVVSRWYGGIKLGPARFGIINAVAREAIIAGDFRNPRSQT
ncbi:MAG: hypothetical protein Q9220_003909 [cf. Caloplaca sp. 1 TL-2023]